MTEDKKTRTSPRKVAALTAMIAKPTITEAAEAAGISTRTLERYLQDRDFREALAAAREALYIANLNGLHSLLDDARETLKRALTCGDSNTEVRAATFVIGQLNHQHELADKDEIERMLEEYSAKNKRA